MFLLQMVAGARIKRSGFADIHNFVICLTPSFQNSMLPLIILFGYLTVFLIFIQSF